AGDLFIGQPPALTAEQDTGPSSARDMAADLPRRGVGRHYGLRLVMGAGGGGKHEVEVGERRLHTRKQLGALQNMVGAGRRAARGDVGPAVARVDDSQP